MSLRLWLIPLLGMWLPSGCASGVSEDRDDSVVVAESVEKQSGQGATQDPAWESKIKDIVNEKFNGTDRALAKTLIAQGKVVAYDDPKQLIKSLPTDDLMRHHNPPIKEDRGSDRVDEERLNVSVVAWIFAVKHEPDNDFHVIIGSADNMAGATFMTAEISGLPVNSTSDMDNFKSVREVFIRLLGKKIILAAYGRKFVSLTEPLKVQITGSVFFDIHHPAGEHGPGPAGMRPNTVWEIHPITAIVDRR